MSYRTDELFYRLSEKNHQKKSLLPSNVTSTILALQKW